MSYRGLDADDRAFEERMERWAQDQDEHDDTPFGRDGDHCPWCAADWKAPHDEECARPA